MLLEQMPRQFKMVVDKAELDTLLYALRILDMSGANSEQKRRVDGMICQLAGGVKSIGD